MMATPVLPSAGTISIAEVLALLDAQFQEMAEAVAHDRYALWLGSGISRDRLPPLDVVLQRLLEFLREKIDPTDKDCKFRASLVEILALAPLSNDDWKAIDFSRPAMEWPKFAEITKSLILQYARVLDIAPAGVEADYLVWEAIDVAKTYGDPTTEPDIEHLCIAILMMEGLASDIVSANWDGLVEKAVEQLAGGLPVLRVCVLDEDTRTDGQRGNLYKFHGCAVLAARDEATYRPKLVGRASQINGWANQRSNEVMLSKLIEIVTTKPTLMLGLSAQDSNIQGVFVAAQNRMAWPWPSHPPAFVFSNDKLGPDHKTLLQNVYKDAYSAANREPIELSALLRAYGKSLLPALCLHVAATKLCRLIDLLFEHFSQLERAKLHAGVTALRNQVAATAVTLGKEPFVRSMISFSGRTMSLFLAGREPHSVGPQYRPISATPVQHLKADPFLTISGTKELSVGIGLFGICVLSAGWTAEGPAAGTVRPGAFQVRTGTTVLQVFFAASAQSAEQLVGNSLVGLTDEAIIIHSHAIPSPMARAARRAPGRTGLPGLQEVSIAKVCEGITNADDLVRRFREEVAL
jgi:hypothetical protein